MRTIRRLCAVALVTGLTLVGIGAAPAAARPVEKGHFHELFSEVIENCGLTLRSDVDIEGRFLANSHGPDGLIYFSEVSHGTLSWTNLANGKTMTASFDSVIKDLKVTDNGDGTLTIVSMSSGRFDVVGPEGGAALRMSTGTIRFEILVDHGGTPTDPSDDEQLDFQTIKDQTGLNEFAGGDFFCEDVQLLIG